MEDFKGTKGNWTDSNGTGTIRSDGGLLDELLIKSSEEDNGTLMAAAPDLLEALQSLFDNYKQLADSGDAGNWRLEDEPAGKKALHAINKALGKE